jgi:iron complex transport system permease protein
MLQRLKRGDVMAVKYFYLAAVIAMLLFIYIACISGTYEINNRQIFNILLNKLGVIHSQNFTESQMIVFWNFRLPRIFLAIIIGMGLATSGAVLQGLFRNPLIEPGLIGVSSGAALFAVLFFSMAKHLPPIASELSAFILPLFTFLGGLLTTVVIYQLSRSQGFTNISFLLLAGIAINAFTNGLVGLTLFYSDDSAIRNFTFWTLGSLSGANWQKVMLSLVLIVIPALFTLRFYKLLDALNLGETVAEQLGANVEKSKKYLISLCALMVGTTVAMAGVIGFVGLVVPHFVRLLIGNQQKYLLTGSMLLGAVVLLLADTISRSILSPIEIPIGIITAIVFTPFFLWLLQKIKSQVLL